MLICLGHAMPILFFTVIALWQLNKPTQHVESYYDEAMTE